MLSQRIAGSRPLTRPPTKFNYSGATRPFAVNIFDPWESRLGSCRRSDRTAAGKMSHCTCPCPRPASAPPSTSNMASCLLRETWRWCLEDCNKPKTTNYSPPRQLPPGHRARNTSPQALKQSLCAWGGWGGAVSHLFRGRARGCDPRSRS